MLFDVSVTILLIVPFGPSEARGARLCAAVERDLVDCVVLVESMDDVRSAGFEDLASRPLMECALSEFRPAWLFPATIFNAQFVIEADDLREEELDLTWSLL